MRLSKVTLKPCVKVYNDWTYLWDLFDRIAGDARGDDTWRCIVPVKDTDTHVFVRRGAVSAQEWGK